MKLMPRLFLLVTVAALLASCASTPGSGMSQSQREKAARINTQLGMAYLQKGELDRAQEKLDKAVKQNPDYAEAHMVSAVLHERLEEPDKARAEYERAMDLSPKDPSLLNNYGRFLCEHGDYDRAIDYFQRAASNRLYKKPELALSNAGICAQRQDKLDRAEHFFLAALKRNSRFPVALFHMAQLRFKAEHYLSARGFYQRYLAVADQTPASLWLGVRIEHALGNDDAVASYSLLLRDKYPESEETKKLLEWQGNDGK